ncbi:spore coat associated protein CotJA [Eggerthella lenta]|nr:spore coat associated protein CotJA [Eggerthella lenta]
MATVPMQPWETPYEPSKALKQGTIFPCLDLPFFLVGGDPHA